jgi:energy-coupling factor transport system ATP-binding protein
MEIIQTDKLKFSYHNEGVQSFVINDIDLKINKGDFVAILGHNGSGKSTLAKHFNALLLPSGGKVYVKGIDSSQAEKWWDIRQTVGMVFQNPDNQIVSSIVEEDVAFGPENLGVKPDEIRRRVDEALAAVDMFQYRKHAPHLLSGGQKQRVAIAGVIAMKPECIVLDEPTAMLDPIGRKEVLDSIISLNRKEGITIILITHFMSEAVKANRVIVMEKGEILMDNKPKNIFSQIEKLKSVGLDVPQVTELAKGLREKGINISENILEIDECVKEINKIFKECENK